LRLPRHTIDVVSTRRYWWPAGDDDILPIARPAAASPATPSGTAVHFPDLLASCRRRTDLLSDAKARQRPAPTSARYICKRHHGRAAAPTMLRVGSGRSCTGGLSFGRRRLRDVGQPVRGYLERQNRSTQTHRRPFPVSGTSLPRTSPTRPLPRPVCSCAIRGRSSPDLREVVQSVPHRLGEPRASVLAGRVLCAVQEQHGHRELVRRRATLGVARRPLFDVASESEPEEAVAGECRRCMAPGPQRR